MLDWQNTRYQLARKSREAPPPSGRPLQDPKALAWRSVPAAAEQDAACVEAGIHRASPKDNRVLQTGEGGPVGRRCTPHSEQWDKYSRLHNDGADEISWTAGGLKAQHPPD
jgi:hypothetical protein